MYKLDIYPEDALVTIVFSGPIKTEEIGMAILEMAKHSDYARHFNGISDCRLAESKITENELYRFNQRAKKTRITHGAWCLLVDRPLETAMAMIFAHALNEKQAIGVFSTVKAASEYLEKDLSHCLNGI